MLPAVLRSALPRWTARLADGMREEWPLLVGGLLLVGLLLVGLGVFGLLPEKGLSGFVGCFLAVYASLVFLQSPHSVLLGDRLKRRLQQAIVSSGVGFYGVLSLSRFLQLELHDLIDAVGEFDASRSQLIGMVRDWLIGFSIDSMKNSIAAMLWPFTMISTLGMTKAAIVLVPLWGLYRVGGWVFPELHAEIEDDSPTLDSEGEHACMDHEGEAAADPLDSTSGGVAEGRPPAPPPMPPRA